MDLIIIIAFVALAMLVSNITAAKKHQAAVLEEDESDEEDQENDDEQEEQDDATADEPATVNASPKQMRDPLEILLDRINGQTGNRRDTACSDKHDRAQSHATSHRSGEDAGIPAEQRAIAPTYEQATVRHDNRAAVNKAADKIAKPENGNSIGSAEDIQELREEFDLRRAVLYSEILKPKFDNNQD